MLNPIRRYDLAYYNKQNTHDKMCVRIVMKTEQMHFTKYS